MHPPNQPQPIWPGEDISLPVSTETIYLGPGVQPVYPLPTQHAHATLPGLLKIPANPTRKNPIRITHPMEKRYAPKVGDSIIGTIATPWREGFKVEINAPGEAALGESGFEYVSRKQRPNWMVCLHHCQADHIKTDHNDAVTIDDHPSTSTRRE
jgi:exosome complex RNA-binding protein Rrp4